MWHNALFIMKRLLLLTTLFLCFIFPRIQSENIVFNHLSVQDGLSQLSVLSLYQDERENIWMGTFCGVNVYNGRFFSYLLPQSDKLNSIHGNEITLICGNKKGEVYLLNENGISIINLDDYSIHNLWNANIGTLHAGESGLWVGVKNELFLLENGQLQKQDRQPNVKTKISVILENSDKSLFIASAEECIILKPDGKEISLPIRNGTTFCKTTSGQIWFGTADNGAYLLDANGSIIEHLHSANGLSNNYIRSIVEDEDSNIWIGTFWGLNKYNPHDNKTKIYINSLLNQHSISHNSVYALLKDKQKNIWIGTYYGGVSYFNNVGNNFEYYDLVDSDNKPLNTIIAGCLQEDESGNLWIATDGAGLKRMDRSTGVIYSYKEKFGNSEYYNNIKTIHLDTNNDLWIGIHLGGIYHYHNGKFTHIPIKIEGKGDIHNTNVVNDIIDFDNNNFLLATLDGVILFDKKTGISSYYFDKDLRQKIGTRIQNIFLDSKQRLWIGTKGEGLSMYNLRTKIFNKYQLEKNSNYNQISNNHITEVIEGYSGEIWVSTYGGGLNLYSEQSNDFIPYKSEKYGFSTNYLQSVKSVNDSLLLIGGKSSLILFNNKKKQLVYEIDYKQGFPLEELLERTLLVTKDKKIYAAGKNGVVHYTTTELGNLKVKNIPITFDKLVVNNKEIAPNDGSGILTATLSSTKEIILRHNQSTFSFDFAAPNYISQIQNEYEYLLENYDNEWRKIVSKEMISYTNIPAGSYTLLLRSINNPEQISFIKIKILPPWYASWWAYCIYLSIAIILISLFIHSQITKRKLHSAEIEKQQGEILNQQKLQFFTNISHEFNTPLTLILGQIENLLNNMQLQQNVFSKIIRIQNNALRLKRLISELLEFRKQEQGIYKLNVYKMDFTHFVKDIFMSFYEYATQKDIEYSFISEGNEKPVWIDPIQMEKVFYNILFNAFKFTSSPGKIEFKVIYESNLLNIYISDTGKGIKKENMNLIFNRFYQSSNDNYHITEGVGIGLSLSKNIITLHKGEISVTSEENKGSTFCISLLYENNHFKKEEIHPEEWREPFSTIDSFKDYDPAENDEERNNEFIISSKPIGDKPTILIVEDNEELQLHLKSIFEHNYNVILASNGKEGFNLAKENSPDIVLSDIMMPEMSGTEMCVKLKSDFETSHIPVVLLTAMISQNHMVAGLQQGADDYIGKPFNSKVLLLRCANIINTRRNLQNKYSNNPSSFNSLELATNELDKQFLSKIDEFLEENIENPNLDVLEMAQHMCMSRSSFYNKIKSITGMTPLEVINSYRHKKAIKILLTEPKINMMDLSVQIGFNSPKYFSKSFKAHYGCTPSQYIKKIMVKNDNNELISE